MSKQKKRGKIFLEMLSKIQKKEELEKKQADMRRTTESAEAERQRKREERARQARQAAIEVGHRHHSIPIHMCVG